MSDQVQDRPATYPRTACNECTRRKQKCDREWPCNHCQKRKVPDQCRFHQPNAATDGILHDGSAGATIAAARGRGSKKRARQGENQTASENPNGDGIDEEDPEYRSLGYMTNHLFASFGLDDKDKSAAKQDWVDVESCPQLESALNIVPQRRQIDVIIQNFFGHVNYHYYIVYPPLFLQEYQVWWERRTRRETISIQWTCLLLSICSCVTQHLDDEMRQYLTSELGESVDELSKQFYDATQELAAVPPTNRYHLINVQRLLHSCYWLKSESKFLEFWHMLSTAVREAQELGLHQDSTSIGQPEFEREMRRRLWCIIETWDWQLSSGLYRPTIIDYTDCDVQEPSLALEDFKTSPLLHMKLQSELVRQLAKRFNAPKNITSVSDVLEYHGMIEKWMYQLPPVFGCKNPDTSQDKEYPWVPFHRYYLFTMAYLMILNPTRAYMARPYKLDSHPDELKIRQEGITYCLTVLEYLRQWISHLTFRDDKFHFIVFAVFDTAAVLCSSLIKDEYNTIPQRDEIIRAISGAITLLSRLNDISKAAKHFYETLMRLARKTPGMSSSVADGRRKKAKLDEKPVPAESSQTTQSVGKPLDTGMSRPDAVATSGPAPIPIPAPEKATTSATGDSASYTEPAPIHPGPRGTSPSRYLGMDSFTTSSTPMSDRYGGGGLAHSTTSSAAPSVDSSAMKALTGGPSLDPDPLHQPGILHPGYQKVGPPMPVHDLHGFYPMSDSEFGEIQSAWNWHGLDLTRVNPAGQAPPQ